MHYIYHRGLKGNNALIATFMSLGVAGAMRIDKPSKRKTHLIRLDAKNAAPVHPDDAAIFNHLFLKKMKVKLDGEYNSRFASSYRKAKTLWAKKYGKAYHNWNIGHTIIGILASAAAIGISFAFVVKQPSQWVLLGCLLYTSPSPRDQRGSRMPSSA